VDVFYRNWSERTKNKVNLIGNVFCLCPIALLLLVGSLDYVSASWEMQERSREAGGLAYPLIPLLKTLIPLTGLMLFSQGLVHAYSCYLRLKHD
jgi:TRAP-type mannitol/chloroaromatic compound transport system permease small subunit